MPDKSDTGGQPIDSCAFYGRLLGHSWHSYGMDAKGLLCKPGAEWDVLKEPIRRCACGAEDNGGKHADQK